jgi:HAE1 family hydrophobic/amphiphilic exporter-1
MSIPALSVRRPVFIASIVLLMLFTGAYSLFKLPVSLFPETNVPFISITTLYPGAGPREVELAISKHLEDELSTIEGVKKTAANSQDSLSLVWVEFRTGINMDSVEQRVRDRVALAASKFPREAETPVIERFNPSNQPVITVFLRSKTKDRIQLTTWAEQELKPFFARIPKVGRIDILGGQRRQIDIVIDPEKISQYRIPLLQIANSLEMGGKNIPAGSLQSGSEEIGLRSVGQYTSLEDIDRKVVTFGNGETSIRVRDLGRAVESSERLKSKAFFGGEQGVVLQVYRQSGANTLAVADAVKKEIEKINVESAMTGAPEIVLVRDGSKMIRDNVFDVWESIVIGVVLTIIIVYFFLGSMRSTLITGFAIPNSLLGAFVLMAAAGFSINILTLLALSLCVGLLVDDAIVVRENIFKHMEGGMPAKEAAVVGANEVAMAVVAVTAAIIAMFGPVGFLQGVTGQFFREFGLVVCFAMLISLFDAMAVAPMLSAYWGGKIQHGGRSLLGFLVRAFDRFQSWLERLYEAFLKGSTRFPLLTILVVSLASIGLATTIVHLPSSFLPADESPEFNVRVQLPVGTNLEATAAVAAKVDDAIAKNPVVAYTLVTVGNAMQELHEADIYVRLKPPKERTGLMPSMVRDQVRQQLGQLQDLPQGTEVRVLQNDITGGGFRPFTLVIQTKKLEELEGVATKIYEFVKKHPGLIDPELELRPGIQELQVQLKDSQAVRFGVTPHTVGMEMRARIEGLEVGKLRDGGYEYDIKLKTNDPSQLWLERKQEILVPNINMTPVDLRRVAEFSKIRSPAKIERVNRSYATRIIADMVPGANIAQIIEEVDTVIAEVQNQVPGVNRLYEGDAESFEEMATSMSLAMMFGVVLLFLVLSSLYESFLLAFLNIITLPLAMSGGVFALYALNDGLNIYSTIGMLLLLGVATKNSILLIDTANHRLKSGIISSYPETVTAIIESSVRRLRPILMTSLALIAGCIPIAIGLNEASAQRTGMGITIVGGTVSSTLFTLVLVPSLLLLVEKGRLWLGRNQAPDPPTDPKGQDRIAG